MADDSRQTMVFKMTTAHGTRIVADAISGALIHAPEGVGIPIVGRWINDTVALICRVDANPITALGTVPMEVVRAYPIILHIETDGGVVRLPGRRLLTAIPGGEINLNRQSVGSWERIQIEPSDEIPPALLLMNHSDTIEALCRDTTADPAILAVLLAGLSPQHRHRLMPEIIARADYPRIFPMLRAVLSAGMERSEWHTQSRLREGIEKYGWVIGDHTYGAPTIVDGQYGSLQIGRYCSIAGEVRIVVANHATDTVTTYPFSALCQVWPSASLDQPDHGSRGVIIGSSVWIGAGATILPGARIGDGAIIGAMAVVAGSVPPYSVVVGNPARVTRQRFDPSTVERLLATRWWDWPDYEVDRAVPLLLADDVAAFLAHAEGH